MAWTRTLALGLLFGSLGVGAQACVVSVDDDPDDNFGGDGGTAGVSGSGGSGNGGRSGSGGSTSGGTGGSAGDATGGTGGSDTFPAPTCEPEDGDDTNECTQCLKQNCCTPWLGCDDETCATEVVFPELNVKKELPKGTPVTIEIPTDKDRRLTFQAGWGCTRARSW